MNVKPLFYAFIILACSVIVLNKFIQFHSTKKSFEGPIKSHEFAGTFYPSDKTQLKETIDKFFEGIGTQYSNKQTLGLIAPHAAYQYSGVIAAHAFKEVLEQQCDSVVILAFSHKQPNSTINVFQSGEFTTPLGSLTIDQWATSELLKLNFARSDCEIFKDEHSLEVQLPFIIKALGKTEIVPVFVGSLTDQNFKDLAQKLVDLSSIKKILIVASTDLSHYLPYDQALAKDSQTASIIENLDTKELLISREDSQARACGINPLLAILYYAKAKDAEVKTLKLTNSGNSTGQKDSVVGYLSATIVQKKSTSELLDPQDKAYLLALARNTLETFLKKGQKPKFKEPIPKALDTKMGAFVTLKKNEQLRGCIGQISSDQPLYKVVQDCAISAAINDSRFLPVKSDELKDISIELSILSPLVLVMDLDEIVVSRDGLLIEMGTASGLLLPQVATENGWDSKTFLEQACYKAGLYKDAYRNKNAILKKFSAIVFHE